MDQNPPVNPQNTKQQVVDALKKATNVLVTVSADPSVDQLAACIGLTLMMNKLDKHCTAVFSGTVPSTIEFLQPEKTLEQNTDSLRDFIISLDRSKADKLRYKIEDNVVKIFITPYRTSLSQADLQYSQGDFNVDVIIALGVDNRDHIDKAITDHGRILHDATVVGVSSGSIPTDVGSINWHDATSSSLCEMLVSISESFQSGLLDTQMATAFLTGIVAETERFSNNKTSPKVMTMSAQLMAAGANQQLIASELITKPVIEPVVPIAIRDKPPKEEPKGDFSVPQEGEKAKDDTSEVISLHHEEPEPVVGEKSQDMSKEPTGLDAPAPPVELESADETDATLERIHIDKAGHVHDASSADAEPEESKELSNTDPSQPMPLMRGHERVISPLPPEPTLEPELKNSYIYDPPKQGGTFTASMNDDAVEEAPPPTGNPVTPMLSHDQTPEESAPSDLSTSSSRPADEDSARQAVVDAVSSSDYKPIGPTPIQALNAQPMNLDPNLGNPADAIDPSLPPPPVVPPPVVFPPADDDAVAPPSDNKPGTPPETLNLPPPVPN